MIIHGGVTEGISTASIDMYSDISEPRTESVFIRKDFLPPLFVFSNVFDAGITLYVVFGTVKLSEFYLYRKVLVPFIVKGLKSQFSLHEDWRLTIIKHMVQNECFMQGKYEYKSSNKLLRPLFSQITD